MAQGSQSNPAIVRGAEGALNRMKYEAAHAIGLNVQTGDYWGDIPARQCGAVGGHMVKKMIEMAEQSLVGGAPRTGRTTF